MNLAKRTLEKMLDTGKKATEFISESDMGGLDEATMISLCEQAVESNPNAVSDYKNGKEKWHGTFKNGKRNGYFTLMMRDGSVAVAEYENGVSKHDYFTVTRTDGTMEKRPLSEIKSFLQ